MRWTVVWPTRWALEANTPAVTRSESPGRKNPIKSPVSAKMIPMIPAVPKVAMRWLTLTVPRG